MLQGQVSRYLILESNIVLNSNGRKMLHLKLSSERLINDSLWFFLENTFGLDLQRGDRQI